MKFVFCQRVRVDQKVIQVDDQEFVKEVSEDIVHVMLEGPWRTAQFKRHYNIFVQTVTTSKRCLPFFSSGHTQPVIPVAYIEFSEVLCTTNTIQHLVNQGKRVTILGSDFVEASIVDT